MVIMSDCYLNLKKKEKKTEALRSARIEYLEASDNITAHPFYWAGYILIGNPQPMSSFPSLLVKVVIGGIAGLLVNLFLIVLKKVKNEITSG
jgi:hypothetical protein